MTWTDATIAGGLVAAALGAIRLAEAAIKWRLNGRRGNPGNSGYHPHEESRTNAKLTQLVSLQQQSVTVQQDANRKLDKLCVLRELDDERHRNVKEQLDRIERGLEE
jgi:hypothetical protein